MAGIYYPPVGFHFKVEFGLPGLASSDSRFMEVGGLGQTMDTEDLAEGGVNGYSHTLPTRGKYDRLTLKRGLNVDSVILHWIKSAIDFHQFFPIPVTVTLLNDQHFPLSVWQFFRAYPVKWSASDLNAKSNDIVVESIELAYAYFQHFNIPGSLPEVPSIEVPGLNINLDLNI